MINKEKIRLIEKMYYGVSNADIIILENYILNEADISQIYDRFYDKKIPNRDIFNQLVSIDPTSSIQKGDFGKYSKKIIELYLSGKININNVSTYKSILTDFHNKKDLLSKNGEEIDINKYSSLEDIKAVLKKYSDINYVSNKDLKNIETEKELIENKYFIKNGEAKLVHEDNYWYIISPQSVRASQYYSCTTDKGVDKSKWCTVYPESFTFYKGASPLYILIDKKLLDSENPKKRLLVQISETTQFVDMEHNNSLRYFLSEHPNAENNGKILNKYLLDGNMPNSLMNDILDIDRSILANMYY